MDSDADDLIAELLIVRNLLARALVVIRYAHRKSKRCMQPNLIKIPSLSFAFTHIHSSQSMDAILWTKRGSHGASRDMKSSCA